MTQFENFILWRRTGLAQNQEKKLYEPGDIPVPEAFISYDKPSSVFSRLFWWEPRPDSWLNEFCGSSVIHGLKYISKRKLSTLERVFWVAAFIASLYASWLMIGEVWERYHKSPVVVTFNPSESETYQIPFPAVTICNKSLFSKSKILELFRQLESGVDRDRILESLRLVNALCSSRQSYLQRMRLVKREEFPEWDIINRPPSQRSVDTEIVKLIFDVRETTVKHIISTLLIIRNHTQSCDQLLRVCSWDQYRRNCSFLFKPIITDYGKCCVFNKLPNELMNFEIDEVDGVDKRERGWTYEEINEWDKWDFGGGFIIDRDDTKYPLRQKRAGNLYGLSVLVDPDIDDGFCSSQDSEGVKILLHTSADSPRISHMGTGIGVEREIFMKVFPDSTIAEESILDYDMKARKCIFGIGSAIGKSALERPYTRNNCFQTCQRRQIRLRCNCTLHYARRRRSYRICNPAASSKDFGCVQRVESMLAGNLKRDCSQCGYACNHLKYNRETTEATLLNPEDLWGSNETNLIPSWANNKMSIIHVFMGSDTHVPKLRQKLYGRVDLIASIGGLLGLTLGFSVLSAIEILYLLTLRVCCKRFRKWQGTSSDTVSSFN